MPASRRTSRIPSDDQYQEKRKKNNASVKKTRKKTKELAESRRNNITQLQLENQRLETLIEEKGKNIQTLKEILISSKKDKAENEAAIRLLKEIDKEKSSSPQK